MTPLAKYLRSLREIRSTGHAVQETSYYGALETLLNDVGATPKPRVRCVINLQNRGAGIPDGGLFTADQFQRGQQDPTPGGTPARGIIEVTGTVEDAWVVADGQQPTRYTLGGYQVVKKWLSYREQALLGRPLREDKAREVTAMTRRIAALLLLQPALDANYQAVKSNTYQPTASPRATDPANP